MDILKLQAVLLVILSSNKERSSDRPKDGQKHTNIHQTKCSYMFINIPLLYNQVDSDGRVVICDVGHSKAVDAMKSTRIGTPHYYAPEIQQNQIHTMESDIYSLGLVFVELLYDRGKEVDHKKKVVQKNKRLLTRDEPYKLVERCREAEPNRPTINEIVKCFTNK